jgi:iron(III) transport system ATP-binding protein
LLIPDSSMTTPPPAPLAAADRLASLDRVSKCFGSRSALDSVSLDVRRGEILGVLGPSGGGKTTLLRCIAGLERPDAGEIRIGDALVSGERRFVLPEDRGLAMLFQSLALWPHLSAEEHLRFVLGGRRLSRPEIDERVADVLESVGLSARHDARPHELSGGERQRLALARALVTRPRLLLLDEPLSSLDPSLREALRDEIAARIRKAGLTAILVTHDQDEAMAIADRIAVMRDGRIEQVGTAEDLCQRPRNRFVAEFVGQGTVVRARSAGPRRVRTLFGEAPCSDEISGERWVAFRPDTLRAEADGSDPEGIVLSRSRRGGRLLVRVKLGDLVAVAESETPLEPGEAATVRAVGEAVVVDE